jgi:hypothetical protein
VARPGVSVFFLMALINQFFGSGSYSNIGPYMAEIWPHACAQAGWASSTGRQFREVHRTGGPRGDRRIVQLRQPAGNARRTDPSTELFRRLVFPGEFAALFGVETRGRSIEEMAAPHPPSLQIN